MPFKQEAMKAVEEMKKEALPPKLGQVYAHKWFNTTPHGVYELASLIDEAIAEAWKLRS